MDDPDFPAPPPPVGDPSGVWLLLAVLSLILNALLGFWLWHSQAAQNRRLDRLESLADHSPAGGGPPSASTARSTAGRVDRLAILLAAAGNDDESKRVLSNLSQPECEELARALLARPAASDRNAALGAVCQFIAGGDPAAAIGLLADLPEPMLRNALAVRIVNLWIEQNPDAAAQWLVGSGKAFLNPESLDAQFARAAVRWAAYAPEAATPFLAGQSPAGASPALLEALGAAGAEWGRRDPAAALRWAQILPVSDPRWLAGTRGILTGWTERDPAGAAAYLQSRYDAGDGAEFYVLFAGTVAERWARADLNAAAQWAAVLPNRRARREALGAVASVWAGSDLAGAARWAAALVDDGARGAAWQVIVKTWPSADLDGEGAWIGNLPSGPDRDEVVALHAAKLAPAEPEKALIWARTIGDRERQAQSVGDILLAWERRDPASVRNWAAANGVALPPASRQPAAR